MTARHFGIPYVRAGIGGDENLPARSRADTPREFYPLPAGSILPDPISDDDRSRIVGRLAVAFLSLVFLVPLILAGIMMGSR